MLVSASMKTKIFRLSFDRSHHSLAYSDTHAHTHIQTDPQPHTLKIKATKISDSFRPNAAVKRSKCKLPFLALHHDLCQCVRSMCLPLCAVAVTAAAAASATMARDPIDLSGIYILVFTEHCSSDDVIFASLFAQFFVTTNHDSRQP